MVRISHCPPGLKTELGNLTLISLLLLGATTLASAQGFKLLYAFEGTPDGKFPQGSLIADKAGNLYSTTQQGGSGDGAVFELSPPTVSGGAWTETILYDFTGGSDGGGPNGNLAFDGSGNLYGTANFGGVNNTGVVYELSPPATQGGAWTETILYDADNPNGGVAFDQQGNLYFTNSFGGVNISDCSSFSVPGCGSVFQLAPPSVSGGSWTATDLYDFGTNGGLKDAIDPSYGVTVSRSGALYGSTYMGGASNLGAVFKLTPPATSGGAWTEAVLYSFKGGTDGKDALGSVIIGKNGVLYGATQLGGSSDDGTIYQVTPPASGSGWKESVIFNFIGGSTGALPEAGVTADASGNLYGTTDLYGGTCKLSGAGCGEVFKLAPPSTSGGAWTQTVLHAFFGTDGANPQASLLLFKGVLYGTTAYGGKGTGNGNGVVFETIP